MERNGHIFKYLEIPKLSLEEITNMDDLHFRFTFSAQFQLEDPQSKTSSVNKWISACTPLRLLKTSVILLIYILCKGEFLLLN